MEMLFSCLVPAPKNSILMRTLSPSEEPHMVGARESTVREFLEINNLFGKCKHSETIADMVVYGETERMFTHSFSTLKFNVDVCGTL